MEQKLEVLLAMQDDEFQQILKNDKILNALEAEKYDKQIEYFQLISILTKSFTVCGLKIQPITPIMWCFLYCIDNRFVTHPEAVRRIDIDVFLYLLHNGTVNDDLLHNAAGFCEKHNINYKQAGKQIIGLIALAFRPQSMLPKTPINEADVRYNVDWLTRIVSMACELTNQTSEYVMREMSLTEALSYAVQFARRNDVKGEIRRRNSDEVNIEIYKRTMELGEQYYNDKYAR